MSEEQDCKNCGDIGCHRWGIDASGCTGWVEPHELSKIRPRTAKEQVSVFRPDSWADRGVQITRLKNQLAACQKELAEANLTITAMHCAMSNKDKELAEAKAEVERLKELWQSVQICLNPPADCNDPVVLKRYMKTVFDKSKEIDP